jgi:rubrerythrin
MDSKEKLIQLIKRQIEIENEHVERISRLEKMVGSAAAKLLLLEMRLDSQKHASLLNGILEVTKGIPSDQTFWNYEIESYVDQLAVKNALETHIKMETDVIAHVQEEIKHTDDEGLALLLQHIADDEKKHHKILNTIVKYMYKIEP